MEGLRFELRVAWGGPITGLCTGGGRFDANVQELVRQNGPVAKYLVSNPCQDACGTIETDRDVRGAPIYLCPGCDSQWWEPREEKVIVDEPEHSAQPQSQSS